MMTALAIGLVLGVTVWWILIQRLMDKPWTRRGVLDGSQDGLTSSAPKVGLWLFMAMATSLFLIFNSAYLMRMGFGHGGLHPWVPLAEPGILWFNTFVLIAASAAMQTASGAARKGDIGGLRKYYTAGGVLSVVFLAGQLLAWRQLSATGQYGPSDPAYSFFILLTAMHGLHLLGGLWVLGRTATRVWRGLDAQNVVAVGKVRQSVRLCTTYWHFLLLVWLGLFTQLTIT
ncbi:cytochrome c oxidase subunit 3 [Candidatus Rariloculus sp.]|uniref:cytochrome c oxidase subunit 3 n=1 Tax=Candidatus Rariloculus sp. TaxID=3101265 RepID=UPI003D0BD817